MSVCDQHNKLGNKLSWVIGLLSFSSFLVMLLIGIQSYVVTRIDATLAVTNKNSVEIAKVKARVDHLKRKSFVGITDRITKNESVY